MQGFECNGCGFRFEDRIPKNSDQEVEIKCPQCGGQEVVQSEAASEFLELLSEMGRTGG